MSDTPILLGQNLHKTYRLGKIDVPVLHGITLAIDQSEWVTVLGASGSGKTSFLNIIG